MMPQYPTEKAVHEELTAFYTWAERAKWYFRKPKTSRHSAEYIIPRDEVICALVRKLVSTQEAIYRLCEAELCNDALALSRMAFENAITIAWVLDRDDWQQRVDLYVHYLQRVQADRRKYFDKYDPDTEHAKRVREQTDEANNEIASRLFPGQSGWARDKSGKRINFHQMATNVLQTSSQQAYELFYGIPSGAVHSDISSTRPILEDMMKREYFSFGVWRDVGTGEWALSNSNLAGRIMLRSLEWQMPPNIAKRATRLEEEIQERYQTEHETRKSSPSE